MTTHSPSRLRGPVSPARRWRQPGGQQPARPAGGTFRQDLIDRVRAEIAAGSYDTPERLADALDIMCRRQDRD